MWHWRPAFSDGDGLILEVLSSLNVSMIPQYPAVQGTGNGGGGQTSMHTLLIGEVEQIFPFIAGRE